MLPGPGAHHKKGSLEEEIMGLARCSGWLIGVLLLLASQPAAAEWTQQHEIFGNGNSLIAVGAGTAKNAVAYGQTSTSGKSQPLLLVTKDGQTWSTAPAPSEFFLLGSVEMLDDKTVYGGGLGMYRSENGGNSFAEVKLPGGGGFFDMIMVNRVFALDAVHVWAASDKAVYWTPNSINWEKTEATVDDVSFKGISFATPQIGWVAGGKIEEITEQDWNGNEVVVGYDIKPKGIVMQTTDGGKNFLPLVIGANEAFRHITFIDQNIGWAVASSNDTPWYLKKTVDGGKSWTDVPLPDCAEGLDWLWVSKIDFTSPLEGWAGGCCAYPDGDLDNLGNKAVILHTSNGGMSWEFDPDGEGKGAYLDLDFAGKHWGYAVGTFAHIMAFTDGTEWNPPDPEGDVVEQPGDDLLAQEDVMSWGNVFGVFGDDVLISQNSYPGGSTPINVGSDDPNCVTETRTTGCSTGVGGSAGAVLLALLLVLLWTLRLGPRTIAVSVALLLVACGGTETVENCKGPDLPQHQGEPTEDAGDDLVATMAPFACGLSADAPALSFGDTDQRIGDSNNLVAYVEQHAAGGSDLFLVGPDGKNPVQLTEFNSPDVHVWNPSWAPGRNAIAFVSDYRASFNDKGLNIFIIAPDRSVCYQLTPDIEGARLATPSTATATLTGTFRYGQGAIASPVANASVAFPGAQEAVTTGSGGEFSIAVPPGPGTLVLRGTVNGMQVKGLAEYEVEDGATLELAPTIGFVEADITIGRLHWSSSGAQLFAFVSEQMDSLFAYDTNSGQGAPFMSSEEDRVVVFAPFPDSPLAVVAYNSEPTRYAVHTLTNPPEQVHEFEFAGQTAQSLVTVSPMRFLATVQEGRLVLLGADAAGEIKTVDITPDNVSGLVPGQLDWAPGGAQVVVTVAAGGKTNLMLVDVNAGVGKALTTNGRAAMPAWFGM